jgi:hypothetical protein
MKSCAAGWDYEKKGAGNVQEELVQALPGNGMVLLLVVLCNMPAGAAFASEPGTGSAAVTGTSTPVGTSSPTPSATPGVTPSATVAPTPEAEVIIQSLNVRSGPGTEYSVIGSLSQGTKVEVLGRAGNGWLQIPWTGEQGKRSEGWTSGNLKYVRVNEHVQTLPTLAPDKIPPTPTLARGVPEQEFKTIEEMGLSPVWVSDLNLNIDNNGSAAALEPDRWYNIELRAYAESKTLQLLLDGKVVQLYKEGQGNGITQVPLHPDVKEITLSTLHGGAYGYYMHWAPEDTENWIDNGQIQIFNW